MIDGRGWFDKPRTPPRWRLREALAREGLLR